MLTLFVSLSGCWFGTGRVEVPVQGYNIFALHKADFDGDGRDDLYSVNHNSAPTLLRSTGNAGMPFEVYTAIPHEPRFPAFADLYEAPEPPESGALIYWYRETFNIRAGALPAPVEGKITFQAEPVVEIGTNATVDVSTPQEGFWIVAFRLGENGHLKFSHKPYPISGWPVTLELASDPELVSIGAPGAHPGQKETLRLHDFHALAVRDLNGDEQPDIVAIGGGLRGLADVVAPDAMEHTFLSDGSGGFVLVAGPPKLSCSSREAFWRGETLHIVCYRGQPDNAWTWKQGPTPTEGEWIGGRTDTVTETGRQSWRGCDEVEAARFGLIALKEGWTGRLAVRLGLPTLLPEDYCALGDFDWDGEEELVTASARIGKVATYMYQPVR